MSLPDGKTQYYTKSGVEKAYNIAITLKRDIKRKSNLSNYASKIEVKVLQKQLEELIQSIKHGFKQGRYIYNTNWLIEKINEQ